MTRGKGRDSDGDVPKVSKPGRKVAGFSSEAKFVRYELSVDEQASCKEQAFPPENFVNHLLKLVEEGYQVSFRWDAYNSCHACWFIPKDESTGNMGYILTGRGSAPLKAFKQALYKHAVIFKCLWAEFEERGERSEIDD